MYIFANVKYKTSDMLKRNNACKTLNLKLIAVIPLLYTYIKFISNVPIIMQISNVSRQTINVFTESISTKHVR